MNTPQVVQFDIKTDLRVFNPATAQVEDLVVLVGQDIGTGHLLKAQIRSVNSGEAIPQPNLSIWLQDLVCPLQGAPAWKLERGTATLKFSPAKPE